MVVYFNSSSENKGYNIMHYCCGGGGGGAECLIWVCAKNHGVHEHPSEEAGGRKFPDFSS